MHELLSSTEQIVLKMKRRKLPWRTEQRPVPKLSSYERDRVKIDDFARVLGVSVAMVKEWESRRVKPSSAELKLMRLIQANPALSKQLME